MQTCLLEWEAQKYMTRSYEYGMFSQCILTTRAFGSCCIFAPNLRPSAPRRYVNSWGGVDFSKVDLILLDTSLCIVYVFGVHSDKAPTQSFLSLISGFKLPAR